MKVMLAADLHGSLGACQQLLKYVESEGVDQLVLLGDLLNHGPRNPIPDDYAPAKVAEALNQYAPRILAVQGNCDSEVDQMLLRFPILSRYSLLVTELGGRIRRLFLTHGHDAGLIETLALLPGDLLATGHSHIPQLEQRADVWHLNPGSTTFPKSGSCASFALLDDEQIGLYRLQDGVIEQQYDWC